MNRRTIVAGMIAAFSRIGRPSHSECWAVYYSDKEPPSAFLPFSTLILDSRYHPPLAPLAAAGKQLIGYISIGEASPDYPYFDELRSEGLLLRPNANWPGNYSIDIRDQRWRARLCDELVPQILRRGFHGLFLDTLDSVLYLEEQNPRQFAGMSKAATDLIRMLRRRYPALPIVLNRGYSILTDVADQIDIVLGESVYTTYNFETRQYLRVSPPAYRKQVQLLRDATMKNSRLRVFTLDYWNADDADGIRRIYEEERANGFAPYVCSVNLTSIVYEPL